MQIVPVCTGLSHAGVRIMCPSVGLSVENAIHGSFCTAFLTSDLLTVTAAHLLQEVFANKTRHAALQRQGLLNTKRCRCNSAQWKNVRAQAIDQPCANKPGTHAPCQKRTDCLRPSLQPVSLDSNPKDPCSKRKTADRSGAPVPASRRLRRSGFGVCCILVHSRFRCFLSICRKNNTSSRKKKHIPIWFGLGRSKEQNIFRGRIFRFVRKRTRDSKPPLTCQASPLSMTRPLDDSRYLLPLLAVNPIPSTSREPKGPKETDQKAKIMNNDHSDSNHWLDSEKLAGSN